MQCSFKYRNDCQETLEINKAIEHLVKAINIKKNFADALLLLGSIFLQTGNFEEGWTLCEARFYIENSTFRIPILKTFMEWLIIRR